MDSVNKTLYIPLYGKAYVSRRGILIRDPKAEEIWEKEGFLLKGKSRSKWLAYYMGMRSAVFDCWLREKLEECPEAVVLHLGCGMDSRVLRVETNAQWYDVDFPEVLRERQRYFKESGSYHMLPADLRNAGFLEAVPQGGTALVVMEGVSMYLLPEELRALLGNLKDRFNRLEILMDCYTDFAARASKYKNPINDVGVTQVYGMDNPEDLTRKTGLAFSGEREMTPEDMIGQLKGLEQRIFRNVFAGSIAKKMYRMYEFQSIAD